jgi:hypothetical protein
MVIKTDRISLNEIGEHRRIDNVCSTRTYLPSSKGNKQLISVWSV